MRQNVHEAQAQLYTKRSWKLYKSFSYLVSLLHATAAQILSRRKVGEVLLEPGMDVEKTVV